MKRLPLMDSIALSCTVYDHESFLPVFRDQASKAKFSLIIMAPYITWFGLDRMIDVIASLVEKKRQVCISVRPPDGYYLRSETLEPEKLQRIEYFQKIVDKLRATGAHVTLSEKIHEKVAIIDGRYLWDGSLNILSFNKDLTTERMTCIDSYYMALCAIGKHELLHCPECHAMRLESKGLRYTLLSSNDLGLQIREKRIARALTQAQLSELTGVSRRLINEIESGRNSLKLLDTVIAILDGLGEEMIMVPRDSLPIIEHVLWSLKPERLLNQPAEREKRKKYERKFQPGKKSLSKNKTASSSSSFSTSTSTTTDDFSGNVPSNLEDFSVPAVEPE